jgi:hypothetical protein
VLVSLTHPVASFPVASGLRTSRPSAAAHCFWFSQQTGFNRLFISILRLQSTKTAEFLLLSFDFRMSRVKTPIVETTALQRIEAKSYLLWGSDPSLFSLGT